MMTLPLMTVHLLNGEFAPDDGAPFYKRVLYFDISDADH